MFKLNILHNLQYSNIREVGINTRMTRMYQCMYKSCICRAKVTNGSLKLALVETHCRIVFLGHNKSRAEPRDQRARLLVLHC